MTFAQFELQYFQPYVYWWLALAALLGLLLGLQLGQRMGARRAQRKYEREADSPNRAVSAAEALDEVAAQSEEQFVVDTAATGDIANLAGIDAKQIAALAEHGIEDLDSLREKTGSKREREDLADALQLEDFVVHKWARMAQFLALDGMTPEWAELLVVFGVSSLEDLAARNSESVHHKLIDLNKKESRVADVPSRQQLDAWVAAAQQ